MLTANAEHPPSSGAPIRTSAAPTLKAKPAGLQLQLGLSPYVAWLPPPHWPANLPSASDWPGQSQAGLPLATSRRSGGPGPIGGALAPGVDRRGGHMGWMTFWTAHSKNIVGSENTTPHKGGQYWDNLWKSRGGIVVNGAPLEGGSQWTP